MLYFKYLLELIYVVFVTKKIKNKQGIIFR